MIVLSAQQVSKAFGVHQVLKDVSFVLQTGQRMGLVGVNGSGKSTLLRLITGELSIDGGSISLQRGMRVGYLAQSWRPDSGSTVLDEMEKVFEPVRLLEEKMRSLEQQMAHTLDAQELERLGNDYARTMHLFEEGDGYARHSLVQGVLSGLGFLNAQHQEAAKLSGGELTRLSLGRLLLQKPDILLLDEPTNHLDLDALKWLEEYLSSYPGAVMLVSHDRYFLDRVCTDMVELLMGESEQYKGNYSRYMEQRVERFESRRRAFDQQQKEIERQEAIIERFRSFNREKSIRAAESRVKKLEKMERLSKPSEEKQIHFRFTARRRMGEEALKVKGMEKSFGDKQLFENASLFLESGDRAILIGANGIGKTTFLECLLGRQQPDKGIVDFGTNADIGYYDQKQQRLHDEKNVINEVWDDFPRMTQTEVRSALGLFLFSGDEVFDKVSTLSGGEKARVALTKLMLRKDNFLILDEPTNHLDADSREMLEEALEDFDGTILAVSHDRYFINRLANKVVVMLKDGLIVYEGNYDEYLIQKERQDNGDGVAFSGITRTEIAKQRRKSREEQNLYNRLKNAVQEAEKAVMQAEEAKEQLEESMADPEVYTNPDRAQEVAKAYQQAKQETENAYAVWEKAEEALLAFEEE